MSEVTLDQSVILTWPAAPGSGCYRFLLRDETTGVIVLKAEVKTNTFELGHEDINQRHRYAWRVQVQSTGGEWIDFLPYIRLRFGLLESGVARGKSIEWPSPANSVCRVIIRDDTRGEIVLKDTTLGNRYTVDWSELDVHHSHRYRVQTYEAGSWTDFQAYQPLTPPIDLLLSVMDRTAPNVAMPEEQLLFLFSVDTEVNLRRMRHPDLNRGVDLHIFGRYGGENYGIDFMMDLLDRFGFKGTFFLDILMEHQFGRDAVERVVQTIQERGHDIQLHLHPAPHLYFSSDPALHELVDATKTDDSDLFRRVLSHALELFTSRVGKPPVAFRAGSYHLCDGYLNVLAESGLRIDSSLYCFKNSRVSPWMRTRTQPFWVNGLLEVPVSWMLTNAKGLRSAHQFLPRNPDAAIRDGLALLGSTMGTGSPPVAVFMMHSYTLLKSYRSQDHLSRARWNHELRSLCSPWAYDKLYMRDSVPLVFLEEPDKDRIDTLTRILHSIAARPGVRGLSFSDIHDAYLPLLGKWDQPIDPIPEWHREAGVTSVSGTRRYSLPYLEYLESREHGATRLSEGGL